MKISLSYINSKLGTYTKRTTLTQYELSQLQHRLNTTEAQMYKILDAIHAASNQINELTKRSREESPQV